MLKSYIEAIQQTASRCAYTRRRKEENAAYVHYIRLFFPSISIRAEDLYSSKRLWNARTPFYTRSREVTRFLKHPAWNYYYYPNLCILIRVLAWSLPAFGRLKSCQLLLLMPRGYREHANQRRAARVRFYSLISELGDKPRRVKKQLFDNK